MKPPRTLHLQWIIWLVLLTACTPTSVPTAVSDALVIAVPGGTEANVLREAIKGYESASEMRVQVETLGLDVYADRVSAVLLAGRADYDLIYLSADDLPRWVQYHALQPFPPDIQSSLPGAATWASPLVFDQQLYALPTQPSAEVLFYRADLFQQAGLSVPSTWPEFLAAARALNAPPDRYGVALAGSDGGAEFAAYLAGFCALSACPPDEPQALAFYRSLYHDGLSGPLTSTATRANAVQALKTGQAAMAVLPLTQAPALLGRDSPLAVAALPGLEQSAVGGLGAWAIPLHAAHAQEAQQFAAWLTGTEGARLWALNGGIPASQIAARDPQVIEKAPYLRLLAGVEHFQMALPQTTRSEDLWKAYHAAVRSALNGDTSPEAALRQFYQQVNTMQQHDKEK